MSPSRLYNARLHVIKGEVRQRASGIRIGSRLILAVEGVNVLDKLAV